MIRQDLGVFRKKIVKTERERGRKRKRKRGSEKMKKNGLELQAKARD